MEWLAWLDRVWGSVAAVPPYVLAVLLLMVFGGWLELVPTIFDPELPVAWLLPAFVLAAYPTAIVLKLFHQEIEAARSSLYVLRARAMGFSEARILLTEILPNAITPALAALANSLAFFITGTFFVEVVFGMTGLGSLTYEAIRNKDLALLVGLCVVFAAVISIVSALLDMGLILANPRLRRQHG
jgi:peptide/nickel transport system permease protein